MKKVIHAGRRARVVRFAQAVAILFLLAALTGCFLFDSGSGGSSGFDPDAVEPIAGWSGSVYDEFAIIKGNRSVTIPSSRAGESVLYVVTNYGRDIRSVTTPGTGFYPSSTPEERSTTRTIKEPDGLMLLRGHPSVTEQNEELARRLGEGPVAPSGTVGASSDVWEPPDYTDDNGTLDFYHYSWSNGSLLRTQDDKALTATLQEERSRDGWRALFWLHDDFNGSELEGDIEALADAFLDPEFGDIFHWVTAVFGIPWGDHGFPDAYIHQGTRDVHVLLYDLNNPSAGDGDGVVYGLFAAVDNFKRDAAISNIDSSTSNERLIFYINASVLNDLDGITSTLAHEFQHMIQFYQRAVLRGGAGQYPTWLNELASLAAEDLVADKMDIKNPAPARMPFYNSFGWNTTLTTWPGTTSPDVLNYYGTSYSFGAFLLRVYGAEVLRTLLTNVPAVGSSTFSRDRTYDRWATAQAVRDVTGTDRSFTELLRRWGIAMITSHDTSVPSAVQVNRSTGTFSTSVPSESYVLESLDAYEFRTYFEDDDDEIIFGPLTFGPGTNPEMPPATNDFIYAGAVPSGGVTLSFNLPQEVVVTVLTKR